MERRVALATLLIALIAAWTTVVQAARAEQSSTSHQMPRVQVPASFVTGESYIGMAESERSQYVMGLYDGLMAGILFGASRDRIIALHRCNIWRNSYQLAEILYQYINEHPEDWHQPVAHVLFVDRMLELCPKARPG